MRSDSGKSKSVWMETERGSEFSGIKNDISADVCIVGAGIAGISTAYQLQSAGMSVVVLDDGPVGGGETGRTTAHLSNALDDRYYNIEKLHGAEGARLAAESHTAAIQCIDDIVDREQIRCGFERLNGYLFVPPGESTDQLDQELEACRRAGLKGVERVRRAPIGSFNTGTCLQFSRQGQFHPLSYLNRLADLVQERGGKVFVNSGASKIEGGSTARIGTKNGPTVTAKHVVVATNSPINDIVTIHTKQAAYRSYVIGAKILRSSVPKGLYWDTPDPYHYVRLEPATVDFDYLIVGGEDHKTGQEDDAPKRYAALEKWTRERFPITSVEYRWSGQVMEPIDYLAFIGRNPNDADNVYIATGDSGHGMTHGTIAGMLLSDLILGRENPWSSLYDPARVTLRAAKEFTRENLNVAAQYADWVTPGEVKNEEEVARGCGALLREGAAKIAVFRDESGGLHRRSAVCPHLGCVVAWNGGEKTWDCPCHGSRFDAYGKVVNGPAISNLEPV